MSSKIANKELDGGLRLPIAEHFYTIQGEGYNAGRAAYFIRLAGCDVGCPWCDAKESWHADRATIMSVDELVELVTAAAADTVVVTGGEPLIYPLGALCEALHGRGVELLLESSGTHPYSGDFDWICLSPKPQRPPLVELFALASELKVIISREEDLIWAEQCAARVGDGCRLYLQLEWSRANELTPMVVEYVKSHSRWRISTQTHKYMQIP